MVSTTFKNSSDIDELVPVGEGGQEELRMFDDDALTGSHPDFSGDEGESIFHEELSWLYDSKDFDHTDEKMRQAIRHTTATKDERALVLINCLIVENAVEDFLLALAPRFRALLTNRDFTLSMKIEIARSLSLCPLWLFDCAHLIRRIRNDFAHDLDVRKLDQVSKDKIVLLSKYHTRLYRGIPSPATKSELLNDVVGRLILGLHIYRNQIGRLRRFIASKEFIQAFEYFVDPLLADRPEWLDNPDVGRSEENGGKVGDWKPKELTPELLEELKRFNEEEM